MREFFPNFPIADPILIFFIILAVVLLARLGLKRFNIPSIVGLILAGVILGPNGVGVLARDSSIILLGTVGLLYIMFMAAIEIDLIDFRKNKHRSLLFGGLTFFLPMLIGTAAAYYLVGLNVVSSVLLASMFASHTLLSYPIATQFGITKSTAVSTAVGGTIITDTAALLVLAIIAASAKGDIGVLFWLHLLGATTAFGLVVFWGIPRVAHLFFKKYDESVPQYIFVLAMVFFAAFVAELASLEPIIGAFAAGLALNKFIPHHSVLMNRVEFIGNAIFIPFFLIGVGMIVDIRVFFTSWETLWIALVMTVVALFSKWLAARLTQAFLHLNKAEGRVIFALSVSQAAATLAAVFVGYNLGFFDESILNGTIIMILVTCLIGSLVMDRWGQVLSEQETSIAKEDDAKEQRIMLAAHSATTINDLMNLALVIKAENSNPLIALHIIKQSKHTDEELVFGRKMLEEAVKLGVASENQVHIVTRISSSSSIGIARSAKEFSASDVLLCWDGVLGETEGSFGSVIDTVIAKTHASVHLVHLVQPLNTFKEIVLYIPPRAELEEGFVHAITQIKLLAKKLAIVPHIEASNMSLRYAQAVMNTIPPLACSTNKFDDWRRLDEELRKSTPNRLIIIFGAREGTLSWETYIRTLPEILSAHKGERNMIVLYQKQTSTEELQVQIAKNRYREVFRGSKRRVSKLLGY
jgi:Kef-type K+ transport system membrane component KefB